MGRLLPFLLVFVLTVFALIDCLSSEEDGIRGLPKIVWVFVILLFPPVGPIVWLIAGRPKSAPLRSTGRSGPGAGPSRGPRPRRPVAPDDDPEFLKGLGKPREDEDLLKQWEEDLRRREDDLRGKDEDRRDDGDKPPRDPTAS